MSEFDFEHEWLDSAGSRGVELGATWARLSIKVKGEPVTRLYDRRSKTVRDVVYLPLYPLAEWLAEHWWALWNEPGGDYRDAYDQRHSLASAREGYSLPPLQIEPIGSFSRLSWARESLPLYHAEFLGHGEEWVKTSTVQEKLAELVQIVVDRLEAVGVSDTRLQADWTEVQAATPEERDFCESAGALGLDPYAMDEDVQGELIAAASRLPREVLPEFFRASKGELRSEVDGVQQAMDRIQGDTGELFTLKQLREQSMTWPSLTQDLPWDQGYVAARNLRSHLRLDGTPTPSMESIGAVLGIDLSSGVLSDPSLPFGGLVGVNRKSTPVFVLRQVRESSRLFGFCRALCEYIYGPMTQTALITDANTERQKRNRAFAAELLVPASSLRDRVSTPELTTDQVEELADEFGVSTFVVTLQLRNHRIARVNDPDMNVTSWPAEPTDTSK